MRKHAPLIWVLVLGPICASAETAYVTDILRLGIHRAEDTSDRPFDNLVSGTELEILERLPSFARVRTSTGLEGWVKSAYLVTEKPAQLRVSEVEEELSRLRAELAEAKAAALAGEETAEQLTRQMASATSSTDAIQETLARLKQQNDGYEEQLDAYRGALPLRWVAVALLATLIAGFASGWWWLDAAIRRRHGGFRVW